MTHSTTVILPSLHLAQAEVQRDPHRFRVVVAGRRWGKSRLAALVATEAAIDGGRAWWVAPTYQLAGVGWRELTGLSRQIPGVEVREVDRRILLPGGGTVRIMSADSPDALRGEGLDLVVLDEAAFIASDAWDQALRPALADRLGKALFISTPRGRNWFHRLYQRGQDPAELEWKSWKFGTGANPYVAPSEILAAKQGMSERAFQQEFEAAFLEDGAGIFRHVREAATATRRDAAEPGHDYVVGADWGKSNDFTVFVVLSDEREVVHVDRSRGVDYVVQRQRLAALAERFRASMVFVELNSIGSPILEELQRAGMPVQGFTTTNSTKAQAVDALALKFERREIRIPDDPVLIAELESFESTTLPSGLTRYAAPDGCHDDQVIALMLANLAISGGTKGGAWRQIVKKWQLGQAAEPVAKKSPDLLRAEELSAQLERERRGGIDPEVFTSHVHCATCSREWEQPHGKDDVRVVCVACGAICPLVRTA